MILAKYDSKMDLFGLILTILPSEAKPLFGGGAPTPLYPKAYSSASRTVTSYYAIYAQHTTSLVPLIEFYERN